MNKAAVFVHGSYRRRDLDFYRPLLLRRTTIAVDGGYSFFRKVGEYPDILIGDFDSLGRLPKDLPERTQVIRHPHRKDKTDSHLAIDYCLHEKARQIDIVMPDCGDIDHALGNIMLLGLPALSSRCSSPLKVRIISGEFEIRLVVDGATTIIDGVGDTISVVPLSRRVVLTCTGTAYRADGIRLGFGDSRGLRNRITARRAVFRLEGSGLVIRLFQPSGRPVLA